MTRPFFIFSLIFTIIFGKSISTTDTVAPWTPIDWKTVPKASSNDSIVVWYLEAPLMEASFHRLFGDLYIYHGAIGLHNLNTGAKITVNYDADSVVASSLLPTIKTLPNGTLDLIWGNEGSAFIYEGINVTYFETKRTIMTNINGTQFNDLLNWFPTVNETKKYYNLLQVMNYWEDGKGDVYVPGWTCVDFCWATFDKLYELGVTFNSGLKASRDFTNLYAEKPSKVTDYWTNSQTRNRIDKFYKLLNAAAGENFLDILYVLWDSFDGDFYLRVNADYYLVPLHFPYFANHYFPEPLPPKKM